MGHTIVDDGSSDGTRAAVEEAFPKVDIVPGTGGLFWAGGMRHGWDQAVRHKKFDYLLVYNDDVHLRQDAVARLLGSSLSYQKTRGPDPHVVVGGFVDQDGKTSYGGLVRCSSWNPVRFKVVEPPGKEYRMVDTMNMNACLISREALDLVGFLSSHYRHSGADVDYGLRLRRSEGTVVLAPGYVGQCDRNSVIGSANEPDITLLERVRRLHGVKEKPFRQRLHHYKQHAGRIWLPLLLWFYFKEIPFRHIRLKFHR